MNPYFVWTTTKVATRAQAKKITAQVQAIDPEMDFVTIDDPGNNTHGWLERPNDGSNQCNPVVASNRRCIEVAKTILKITS